MVGTPTRSTVDDLGRTITLEQATAVASGSGTTFTVAANAWRPTRYGYDVLGRRVSMTSPKAVAGQPTDWSWTYDLGGRVVSASDPDAGVTTTSYLDTGEVAMTIDARGAAAGVQRFDYDLVGRPTARYSTVTGGTAEARWFYDRRYQDGVATAELWPGVAAGWERVADGQTYRSEVTGVIAAGLPTGSRTVVPSVLAAPYVVSQTYSPTGLPLTTTVPAVPGTGLAAEALTTGYTATGLPSTLSGAGMDPAGNPAGSTGLVSRVWYVPSGGVNQIQLKGGGLVISDEFDPATLLLKASRFQWGSNHVTAAETSYSRDVAGRIVMATESRQAGVARRVCYAYDPLGQLVEQWTAAGETCGTDAPTTGTVAARVAAVDTPVWQSWAFNLDGTRASSTRHVLYGQTGTDQTTSYTYPRTAGKRIR